MPNPSIRSPSKAEGYRSIHRSGNLDSDEISYFLARRPTSTGDNTSESEVSPFGLSRPATLQRRSPYKRSEVSDESKWGSQYDSADTVKRQVSAVASNFADPPRPAREGMEWVWFPEGYWAERERRELFSEPDKQKPFQKWFSRLPPSEDHAEAISPTVIPQINAGSAATTTGKRSSMDSSRRGSNLSKQSFTVGIQKVRRRNRLSSSTNGEKEGLYCKTKRTIEARLFRRHKGNSDSTDSKEASKGPLSRTMMLLEGTTRPLERILKERHEDQLRKQQKANGQHDLHESGRAPVSPDTRRRHGLAPWHRRNSNDSMLSVSSSVHRILMGKSPLATPASISDKSNADTTRSVAKFDPFNPKRDTFLPTEAVRIKTPPMTPGTPSAIPPPRGFFFDNTHNTLSPNCSPRLSLSIDGKEQLIAMDSTSGTPASRPFASGPRKSKRANKSEVPSYGEFYTGNFEINTPEHLPSSPLCPKNPKHKSGGTGICVYHGRGTKRARSDM